MNQLINNTISFQPKCKKCGRDMYAGTHIIQLPQKTEPVLLACWQCSCGNAEFTNTQLKDIEKQNKKVKKVFI